MGLLICADIEVCQVADAAVAAGADLLLVIACTYVPTHAELVHKRYAGKARPGAGHLRGDESPAWLGAVAHAARLGVFVAYCNQAKGISVSPRGTASGTFQGGGSRLIAPDGRDVVVAPESEREALLYATLGSSIHHRLAWSGAALRETLAAVGLAELAQPLQ